MLMKFLLINFLDVITYRAKFIHRFIFSVAPFTDGIELQVETFGAMAKTEKIAYILDQVQLFLLFIF